LPTRFRQAGPLSELARPVGLFALTAILAFVLRQPAATLIAAPASGVQTVLAGRALLSRPSVIGLGVVLALTLFAVVFRFVPFDPVGVALAIAGLVGAWVAAYGITRGVSELYGAGRP
jgi:hypothetical protein